MNNTIPYIILILILLSCGDKEPPRDPVGYLNVGVVFNGQALEGAEVTVEPTGETVISDDKGFAFFEELPVGDYIIKARVENELGGLNSASVVDNVITNVTVGLSDIFFQRPIVDILSPNDGQRFNLGEEINFRGFVSDEADVASQLSINWISTKDGLLNKDPANIDGNTSFSSSMLTLGPHTIELRVRDSDDKEGFIWRYISVE